MTDQGSVDVKRYGPNREGRMLECATEPFVHYTDYAALQQKLAASEAARVGLEKDAKDLREAIDRCKYFFMQIDGAFVTPSCHPQVSQVMDIILSAALQRDAEGVA